MDASLVVGMTQWIMAELVRIFHFISVQEATLVVESLIDRTIPLLWHVGAKVRVLNPSLSAKEQTLAVLYGTMGSLTASKIADAIEYKNVSQLRTKVLKPAHKLKLLDFDARDDVVTISPLGQRYVEDNITLNV
jgi:hypothetical protein